MAGALRYIAKPQQDQNWQPFVRFSAQSNNNSGYGSIARLPGQTIVVAWSGTEMPTPFWSAFFICTAWGGAQAAWPLKPAICATISYERLRSA